MYINFLHESHISHYKSYRIAHCQLLHDDDHNKGLSLMAAMNGRIRERMKSTNRVYTRLYTRRILQHCDIRLQGRRRNDYQLQTTSISVAIREPTSICPPLRRSSFGLMASSTPAQSIIPFSSNVSLFLAPVLSFHYY